MYNRTDGRVVFSVSAFVQNGSKRRRKAKCLQQAPPQTSKRVSFPFFVGGCRPRTPAVAKHKTQHRTKHQTSNPTPHTQQKNQNTKHQTQHQTKKTTKTANTKPQTQHHTNTKHQTPNTKPKPNTTQTTHTKKRIDDSPPDGRAPRISDEKGYKNLCRFLYPQKRSDGRLKPFLARLLCYEVQAPLHRSENGGL